MSDQRIRRKASNASSSDMRATLANASVRAAEERRKCRDITISDVVTPNMATYYPVVNGASIEYDDFCHGFEDGHGYG